MEHREKPTKLIAIKNTRSLHAMQLLRAPPGLSGSTGAFRSGLLPRFLTPRTPATAIRHCDQQGADFEYKLLSCFCSKCLSKEDTCLNEKYTGEWQKCTLYKKETRPKKGAAKRKLDTPETPKPKRAKSKVHFVSFCIYLLEHKILRRTDQRIWRTDQRFVKRLNARSIKMLYRREFLTLIKDGTYMGA